MLARTPRTAAFLAARTPQKKLTHEQRQRLVDSVADILRTGEPTAFALEGVCRYALRAVLCLAGWKWLRADLAAADIVEAALRLIGAKRPTWLDGQPVAFQDGAQIPRERCLGCGRQLLGDLGERFCSRPCKGAWRVRINAEWQKQTERAEGNARSLA